MARAKKLQNMVFMTEIGKMIIEQDMENIFMKMEMCMLELG